MEANNLRWSLWRTEFNNVPTISKQDKVRQILVANLSAQFLQTLMDNPTVTDRACGFGPCLKEGLFILSGSSDVSCVQELLCLSGLP